MRSAAEIRFRLRQELANARLRAFPPVLRQRAPAPQLAGLPDPAPTIARLRGTAFAAELERLAEGLLAGRFPLLGLEVQAGPQIRWRRDPLQSLETPARYFRRIPYLDCRRAGDHKLIWELNRHQHLVLLAQAYRLTGRAEFLAEIPRELESWFEQNPFQRGINWASALEVGFRALSWMWVFHLVGAEMPATFRGRFLEALYRHGRHLEHNLSFYFSRNTHLIGEAAALHALGVLFPSFPRAARWEALGAETLRRELVYQVHADGAHFEHSSYYHLYALDFFLLHYLLCGRTAEYRPKLARMAEYLAALLGAGQTLPLVGDDDGGRVFHPYGERAHFGRATLATCALLLEWDDWEYREEDLYPQAAWWLGEEAWRAPGGQARGASRSRLFAQAGLAVMTAGEFEVLVDAGPFGAGRGGHSHSDTLSLVARYSAPASRDGVPAGRDGAEELLVDAGAFTYVGEPAWRGWFRSSAAHNTVRVNERDQAEAAGPFAWHNPPAVRVRTWVAAGDYDFLDAECSYRGIRHRRRVLLLRPGLLLVLDDVEGPGELFVEQFWHAGQEVTRERGNAYRLGAGAWLVFPADAAVTYERGDAHGWRSRVFGRKEEAPVLCAQLRQAAPVSLAAVLARCGVGASAGVSLQVEGASRRLRYEGAAAVEVVFGEAGRPEIMKA